MVEKGIKWLRANIIDILALMFAVATYYNNKEIKWGWFCIAVSFMILLLIIALTLLVGELHKEYNLFKSAKKRLRDEAERQGDTPRFDYALKKEKMKEKFIKKCKKMLLKKSAALLLFIVIIGILCFFNPQNAYAYWDNLKNITVFTPKEEESTDEEIEDSSVDVPMGLEEEINEETEEAIQEERDKEWRFILDEPPYSFELASQMEEQVFFEVDMSFIEWGNYVQETVKQWKGEKEGVNYLTIKDEDGNGYLTYTEMEDQFKNKVNNSSDSIYYDEWLNEAPHSFEYDKCIAGRERLNRVEVDGKSGCYELWWNLANDYQYFALEYEHQTTDKDAILYYYTNSIYCCMEALKYPMSEETYNMIYHYMVTKYHDICDDRCMISQEYKIKASNIYSILVETDVKKTLSK